MTTATHLPVRLLASLLLTAEAVYLLGLTALLWRWSETFSAFDGVEQRQQGKVLVAVGAVLVAAVLILTAVGLLTRWGTRTNDHPLARLTFACSVLAVVLQLGLAAFALTRSSPWGAAALVAATVVVVVAVRHRMTSRGAVADRQ